LEVPAPPFPEAPPNEPSCPTALDHHPHQTHRRPVFDAPPSKPCEAVPPAPVDVENQVPQPPDHQFHHATVANIFAPAPYHPPLPVIVENTELLPIVPFVLVHHPAPPVPTVTVYACGVTVKEALYWYHPAPHHPPHS